MRDNNFLLVVFFNFLVEGIDYQHFQFFPREKSCLHTKSRLPTPQKTLFLTPSKFLFWTHNIVIPKY